jgi:dienelactone hydrolase
VDETIAYLSEYIAQYGPFDGVIGFSQGAAIALMLASLCEKTPGRTTALQDQAAPLLSQPPQQPFTFAIAVSGFKGLQPYFDGFYEPKIATPSLHAIADWDTVIDAWETEALAAACEDTKIIRHPGAHVFPSHGPALRQMLDFVHDHVTPQRSDLDIEVPDFIISWRGLPSRHRTSSPSATAVLSEKSMLRPSMTVRSLSAGSTSSVDTTISTLSSSTDHSQSRRPWHVGRNYRSRRVIRVHNV